MVSTTIQCHAKQPFPIQCNVFQSEWNTKQRNSKKFKAKLYIVQCNVRAAAQTVTSSVRSVWLLRDLLRAYLLRYYTDDAAGQNIQAPSQLTQQPLILLCHWPLPTDNIYWDITPGEEYSMSTLTKYSRLLQAWSTWKHAKGGAV